MLSFVAIWMIFHTKSFGKGRKFPVLDEKSHKTGGADGVAVGFWMIFHTKGCENGRSVPVLYEISYKTQAATIPMPRQTGWGCATAAAMVMPTDRCAGNRPLRRSFIFP
jgi:hypothetical protein